MNRLNALISNSFVYRLIEWLCVVSQKSVMFKVKLVTYYREKRFGYEKYGLYHRLTSFGTWLDLKVNESITFEIILKIRGYLLEHSRIAKYLSGFQWIYLLPFFVWIDRVVRYLQLPMANLWDEFFIIFLIFTIGYRRWFKGIKFYFTTIDFGILCFTLVYFFITFANSSNLNIGLEGFRVVTQYLLTFTIVVQLADSEKRVKGIIWCLLISVGLLGLHGVYQFATGVEIPAGWVDSGEDVRTRAFSILGSPNALASVLVMILPVGFSLFLAQKEPIKKIFALFITVVMGLGLLFTLSRGAWAAAGIGFLVFFFMVGKRLIFTIISLGLLAVVGINQIWQRVFYLLTPEYMAKSATGGRIFRYSESLEQWALNNQWFGLGVGRFGGAVATNHGLSPFYMDSFYLKTLAEAGLLGIFAYGALIINTVVQGFLHIFAIKDKQYRIIAYGLISGMIGVLIHNAVENIFEIPYMVTYFWALAALIVALYRVDAGKRKVKDKV